MLPLRRLTSAGFFVCVAVLLAGASSVVKAADGDLDESFNSAGGPDSWVRSIVYMPGGKVPVGGEFKSVNGVEIWGRTPQLRRNS